MSSVSACVLIAEDEVLIADLVELTLVDEGLETTVAYSGSAALAELEKSPMGFQVLVTDIRVGPAPNGWAIARAAREVNPDIGVIYITADSMAEWAAHGVSESVLISKPFDPNQIVTAVTAMLRPATLQ